jgi:hypothetical protein
MQRALAGFEILLKPARRSCTPKGQTAAHEPQLMHLLVSRFTSTSVSSFGNREGA